MSTFENELANLYNNSINSQGSQESVKSAESPKVRQSPPPAPAPAPPPPIAAPVALENIINNINENDSLNVVLRGNAPVKVNQDVQAQEPSNVPEEKANAENKNSLNAVLRGNIPAQAAQPVNEVEPLAEAEAEVKEEPAEADGEEEDSLEAVLQGEVAPQEEEQEDQWNEEELADFVEEEDAEDAKEEEEEEEVNVEDAEDAEEEEEAPANRTFASLTDPELLDEWDRETDFAIRDRILLELQRRNLFPSAYMDDWEGHTGAYPDIKDPEFLQKLLAKREFAESLQTTWEPPSDPCEENTTFEVTPVQRFVANFMSPKTPYMSALLFHGVGVGKTCAAVQIAEAWLEAFPNQPVYLVAPRTIQQGFLRTIFDISSVTIGEGNEPNTANQCTGITYMKLSNTLYERDPVRIQKQVNKLIRRRYDIYGYQSFANAIESRLKGIPTTLPMLRQNQLKKQKIREAFSGRLLIVDEAHNLRDVEEKEGVQQSGLAEKEDTASGKRLTPFLKQVLQYSEGLKFCALTATPMYNTYKEIIFMLNLLLMNDKQATITEKDIFDLSGDITERGRRILTWNAQRYISFMRGENPISFPVRLSPMGIPKLRTYPSLNPSGAPILNDSEKEFYSKLPIVPIPLEGEALRATEVFMRDLSESERLGPFDLEKLVHAGNLVVPMSHEVERANKREDEGENEEGQDILVGELDRYKRRTDKNALQLVFDRDMVGGYVQYRAKREGGADWLRADLIRPYSPKIAFFLDRAQTAEGCLFVYTRFVNSGAIPLALALEANGYTAFGREPLLRGASQLAEKTGGRQCAACPKREKEHEGESHKFTPAYYGILTGEESVSPDNAATIAAQRRLSNKNGIQMKIIIGSQIAAEGVDLRFVRETHVLDSWFHLNKTEQILGRAIRYLSHCALPEEKRNTTVYLYVATLPSDMNYETADMYSYRYGFNKALLIGNVTRTIKQASMDCNLNHDAIIIRGQAPIRQIDSQGRVRDNVNINDMPFTAVCDWIETCEYQCTPTIAVPTAEQKNGELPMDDSTYDEYSARWRVHKMKARLRMLFANQTFYSSEDLWNSFSDVSRLVMVDLLSEVIDNKNFQVECNGTKGYIRYCNGYYLFQPNVYADLTIPIAVRAASFPVKRDVYAPDLLEDEPKEGDAEEKEGVEDADEEKREMDKGAVQRFWKFVEEWTERLSRVADFGKIPAELTQRIKDISKGDKKVEDAWKEYVDAIQWFHVSFHKSSRKNEHHYRLSLLQYFWDEWLSMEEQKYLVFQSGLNVENCIRDSQYRLGKVLVTRFMNPTSGEMTYFCEGESLCSDAVVRAVTESEKIPFSKREVGALFGFLAPKHGHFVFKTDDIKENKPIRGQECANSSNMPPKIKILLMLGDVLKDAGHGDFDLSDNGFITRPFRAPGRACTLMNLVLRFLHLSDIQKKQWFFRPVKAHVLMTQMKKPPKRK